MKLFILTIFLLCQLDSFAQTDTTKYNFDHKIMEVFGDVNKDNLPDKIIVMQDTKSFQSCKSWKLFYFYYGQVKYL